MSRAASFLLGAHDFSAFTSGDSDVEDRVRRLEQLDIRSEGETTVITAAADGFLRYMVRAIAGTLIDVGRGHRSAESAGAALKSLDRSQAGQTAPASGLTLLRVDY
jgi:tRNA pseudouridine38-40 synthase